MTANIQNTKEVLKLVVAIAKPIIAEVKKDGYQPADLVSFITTKEFQDSLIPAIQDITLVPTEMKEMTLAQKKELILAVIGSTFELLD